MSFKLNTNPYFDVLGLPVDLREFSLALDLDIGLLTRMQITRTFIKWRKKMSSRDQARSAFLSVSPSEAVKKLTPDDFQKALEYLEVTRNFAERDAHLRAVLKVHESKIRRRMRALQKVESGSG
jgi:hypothetical protein